MASGLFTLKQQVQAIRQGAWTNQPPIAVNYLVVGGGGGGGYISGGGGAGGFLQGSIAVAPGASITVTVGAGGNGGASGGAGTSGSNSVFGAITSIGGGYGGAYASTAGASGGSGGGGYSGGFGGNPGQGTAGQGNSGGLGNPNNGVNFQGGGGGGGGTAGLNAVNGSVSGNGGAGIASDISGSRVTYAGGGGGAADTGGTAGSGGAGGGGAGGSSRGASGGTGAINGASGTANTGGGGGGYGVSGVGGSGGSGIVIISYPGTTQWFTGGVVNYYNGSVIHIFYQSGTLTPAAGTSILPTYQISRSLRYNSASSQSLTRTPSSSGNRQKWTLSLWMKHTDLSTTYQNLAANGADGNNRTDFQFVTNALRYRDATGGTVLADVLTDAVFRDPSAWYHVVYSVDTTQATAANRIIIYVNNVAQSTTGATYYSQNANTYWNQGSVAAQIGNNAIYGTYFNGYMTDVYFIDGQALTPSSFGQTNAQTGVWGPIAYTGTYGTNGFYLNFSDNSNTTATTLGKDYSGNGNNWTPNNFSVAAGVNNSSMVDTPTPYGTSDTGVGGEVRGNYCTWNPLGNSGLALSNGNLQITASGTWDSRMGTIGMSSGKWYWEINQTTDSVSPPYVMVGVATGGTNLAGQYSGYYSTAYIYYSNDGKKWTNNVSTTYGATWQNGDVVGVAFDADNGVLTFYKNGTSQGNAFTGLTSGPYFPVISAYTSPTSNYVNFGQRPFAYTAPAGYRALTTWNLPTPPVGATTATQAGKFFNPVLWTANGGVQSITGVGFQPDFLWIKDRQNANSHRLQNIVAGASRYLSSDNTNAETLDTTFVTSIDSDGWSMGSGNYSSGRQLVAWNWKANGSGSSNTAGSITSTVSANTTSGFSIVTWTGNSANATIGHGLGVAPSMVIIKYRGTTDNWYVYHTSTGTGQYLVLNGTGAAAASTTIWQNTAPTSTVFSIGSGNNNSTVVAYCFAAVPGYSAFGSYTGNGSSDGPFVYTGFRPAYVMLRASNYSSAINWFVYDSVRGTYNLDQKVLLPNDSVAELDNSIYGIDLVSNGFKVRNTNPNCNISGVTYIYAAFAESPFKYSLAR